jgi:hypothetical protein
MVALDGLAIAGGETRHEPAAGPPLSGRRAADWDHVRVFSPSPATAQCVPPGGRSG